MAALIGLLVVLGTWSTGAGAIPEVQAPPGGWTFRNHVQPILAKYGCSSGPCHGAAAGKNGFKLTLRGYDDEADYVVLTRHALGRRVIPNDPGRSLLLLKPTGALPHKGGQRFETHSIEYRVLSEWIASGAPGPRAEDARIERIEVIPDQLRLAPGDTATLEVRAWFSNGSSEDITRWAKYTDTDASVTQVDDSGKIKVMGFGQGAITAWYLSTLAMATVTVPYTNALPSGTLTGTARRNFIDDLVLEQLERLNLPPSPACSDAEFIRRVYLDTLGVLPTVTEVRAFLSDTNAGKRDSVIEGLFRRNEFVDYWAYRWSDLLLVQSKSLKPSAMWAYYRWIRNHVAANTPWDRVARQVVTASGSNLENGAAAFYLLHDDPKLLAENTTQTFLGMSISCAKCHNHPMEKWTNDEYYGFANLFARVRLKNGGGEGERIVLAAAQGDLVQPRTGKPQAPRPLDGAPLDPNLADDRRHALADWLVSPDNAFFARAIVNRLWASFFGVGLVEPVDDMRLTNPASNEKLLAAAARFLVEQHYDLQALMRAILQSQTYQRSSRPRPENAADKRFYSRYYPKRLPAEVLLDAFSQAAAVPTEFPGYPRGWRALQLPDVNVDSLFLKSFGRPERERPCECERTDDPNVSQVLHLANGETLNKKLTAPDNRLGAWLKESKPAAALIEELYLATVSRPPTEAEKGKLLPAFEQTAADERRPWLEDLCWALLSSREFLFNH